MYCIKCGKQIDEDSIFCQFCGNKVSENKPITKKGVDVKDKPIKKSKTDLLWEKFIEIYSAKDDERTKFNAFSSVYLWELLERLSVNTFESFIQENKEELNKQPYKTIEAIKNVYAWTVSAGYKLWLAEALLNSQEDLNKFKSFSLDEFVKEWKRYDFEKARMAISDEMSFCITQYTNFTVNNFFDDTVEAKELSNATVEKLKTSLLFQTVNGYHAGKIENTFRK